jgi:hypothetical protein
MLMIFVQDLSTDLKEPSQDERAPAFIWRYVLTMPALIEPCFPPKTALFLLEIQMEVIHVSHYPLYVSPATNDL